MDLNQLKIFAKVVEQHSFTGAAKLLGLTKTTVSRKVSDLETRVGVQLLTRTTRKVNPTPQGFAFYQNIANAFNDMKVAEQQLQAEQYLESGTIKLVLPYELNQIFSSAVFSSFIQAHPDINLDIAFANKGASSVMDDDAELAFHFDEHHAPQIETTKLLNFSCRLAASPQYIARHGMPLTPEALNRHHYIDCSAYDENTKGQLNMFDGHSWLTLTPKVRLTMDSFMLAKELAVSGLGITALPEELAEEEVTQGRLVTVLDDYPMRNHVLYMSYLRQSPMPSRTLLFIRHVYDQLNLSFANEVLEIPAAVAMQSAFAPQRAERLAG
ncbi:LysR family transcriptional regulator [Shewanella sp. A3A]|nr:LysR family transcriptional regulator [Shewanella ferrihydritica]